MRRLLLLIVAIAALSGIVAGQATPALAEPDDPITIIFFPPDPETTPIIGPSLTVLSTDAFLAVTVDASKTGSPVIYPPDPND